MFRLLLRLNLRKSDSSTIQARVRRRYCGALLKEPIIHLLSGYWHRKQHASTVVIVVTIQILQHKECPSLCLLSWEHKHQRLISQCRQSEPTLAMHLAALRVSVLLGSGHLSCELALQLGVVF